MRAFFTESVYFGAAVSLLTYFLGMQLKKRFRLAVLNPLLLSILFGLTHEYYVTLLPKSITTAIGMGVSEELGGYPAITVAVIIITGVLGNMTAVLMSRLLRIKSPVARGLMIGTASHAIGTAKAMEIGEIEGAMSSLAIVICGLLTVILASFFAMLY